MEVIVLNYASIPWYNKCWWYFAIYPFQSMYLLSYWKGAPMPEICARLTNVSAEFWQKHPEECEEVIIKDMQSYFIGMLFLIYVLVVYKMLSLTCQKIFRV